MLRRIVALCLITILITLSSVAIAEMSVGYIAQFLLGTWEQSTVQELSAEDRRFLNIKDDTVTQYTETVQLKFGLEGQGSAAFYINDLKIDSDRFVWEYFPITNSLKIDYTNTPYEMGYNSDGSLSLKIQIMGEDGIFIKQQDEFSKKQNADLLKDGWPKYLISGSTIKGYRCEDYEYDLTIPHFESDSSFQIYIGKMAFKGCRSIQRIFMKPGIIAIDNSAFEDCTRLNEVHMPDTVQSILTKAFYNCKSLTTVEMSNNLTWINPEAFSGCIELSSIVLPRTLEGIGPNAFANCPELTAAVYKDTIGEQYCIENGIPFIYAEE